MGLPRENAALITRIDRQMATKRQMTHARLKMLTGVKPTPWRNQAG
jgi:hypothetical protein